MPKKLLVIDDQPGTTKAIGLIARQMGLEVRSLNSSLHAVETFIEYRPDIVILDMIMPEKDGIDVLHEILQTGLPVQIVVASGHGGGFLRLAKAVGQFHDHAPIATLRKPFRRETLAALLTELTEAAPGEVLADASLQPDMERRVA